MFKRQLVLFLCFILCMSFLGLGISSAQDTPPPPLRPPDDVTASIQQDCGYGEAKSQWVQRILENINQLRLSRGRTPVVINPVLCDFARQQAITVQLNEHPVGFPQLNANGENIITRITNLNAQSQPPTFLDYPSGVYNVDIRTFTSTQYSFFNVINSFETIDDEIFSDRRQFLLNQNYREIGIGYIEDNGVFYYIFILGSQPNVLPVIPYNINVPNIYNANFPSNNINLWVADERFYTGDDLDTIGSIAKLRVSLNPEKRDCSDNTLDWQSYSYPDGIEYTVQGTVGPTILYVQLCDSTGSQSRSQVMEVQVNIGREDTPPIEVSFDATPTTGESPLVVNFADTSTNVPPDATYRWDFNGDELTDSTDRNPEFTYQSAGIYNVTLEVLQNGIVLGSTSTTITVNTNPTRVPTVAASFTIPPLPDNFAPVTVLFNNTSSNGVEYFWDFDGDGLTDSTDENPRYTFEEAGEYTITLTAVGGDGISVESEPQTITILRREIVADFTVDVNQGTAPLTVTFANNSTGDNIATYQWDFDSDTNIDSTVENPTHTYEVAGDYIAKLIVTDIDGNQDEHEIPISVQADVPVVDFTFSPESGQAPLTVTFTDTSIGVVDGYVWDFNTDGTGDSEEASPSFVYEVGGTYTITLTVLGPGGSATIEKTITIEDAPEPTATPTVEASPTTLPSPTTPPTDEPSPTVPPSPTPTPADEPSATPITPEPTTEPSPSAIPPSPQPPTDSVLPLSVTWNDDLLVLTNTTEQDVLITELNQLTFVQGGTIAFEVSTWFDLPEDDSDDEDSEPFTLLLPDRCVVIFTDGSIIDATSASFPTDDCNSIISQRSSVDAFWTVNDFQINYNVETVVMCSTSDNSCVLDYAAYFAQPIASSGDIELVAGTNYLAIRNISGSDIATDTITQLSFANGRYTGRNWSTDEFPLPQFDVGDCLVIYAFGQQSNGIQGRHGCGSEAAFILVDRAFWLDGTFDVTLGDASQICSLIGGRVCRLDF